ncbi:hypothetical protein QWI17_19065 [Gilvimarinus sp. SDUM040013]|uniref:Uncharacterized protein n=1 Tax=Gilvimarinus gilvus TaxID=3058038 RepID=A0ABU4RWQ0_9GAMM|nr:hypothetical protein [Gilvimarinus sp. SDUM040013]MDO3387953.1 hypothetical protein [Gilvimarinus sp. SDUM040013]MDX6848676.1 hypothetical protein [Gilvimarinus sp. SDUM040013]
MKRFLFEHQLIVRTPILVDAEDEHEARMKIDCRMAEPGYPSHDDLGLILQRYEEVEL